MCWGGGQCVGGGYVGSNDGGCVHGRVRKSGRSTSETGACTACDERHRVMEGGAGAPVLAVVGWELWCREEHRLGTRMHEDCHDGLPRWIATTVVEEAHERVVGWHLRRGGLRSDRTRPPVFATGTVCILAPHPPPVHHHIHHHIISTNA